ncbi:anti-sigma factor family protein [Paenibacillus riograndensis]|uniref:Anti-sigma-W factor RsiW n=1 Tax=Paenibacillus riograndensis SBR5 TaxID=1073571 RepID=A0A0E4HCZ0_9BACL|nr:zf-HC2 domain-containing protein [Paenibacillus riograndensis]CQR57635.1 putative membrane protein [Paenibacillus riograndensis SBR5]
MKCAEVMEWMHRYLDHDLSQEEIIEMFRHIDNCPSCADVYDRLSTLSRQLEQLPDVKPPFSLVDSIMPRLDELDRGVQEPVMTGTDESNVVPLSRKSSHGKIPKGSSMAARTGIGAVAAAIILLIAIFNMPEKMPAADVEQALNQSADTGSSLQKSIGSTEPSQEAGQEGNADGATGSAGQEGPAQDNMFSAGGSGDNTSGGTEDLTAPSTAPSQDAPAVAPETTKKPDALKRQTQKPDKAAATPAATPAPQNSVISSPDANGDTSAQDSAPMEGKMRAGDSNSGKDIQPSPSEFGIMNMMPAMVAASPATSPDGRFDAELAGQQLVIYSIPEGASRDDRKALTSLPLEGEWVSGEWSEDSREFTYVTTQNGSEIRKTYTVPDSAATGAPSASQTVSPTATTTPVPTPDPSPSAK